MMLNVMMIVNGRSLAGRQIVYRVLSSGHAVRAVLFFPPRSESLTGSRGSGKLAGMGDLIRLLVAIATSDNQAAVGLLDATPSVGVSRPGPS